MESLGRAHYGVLVRHAWTGGQYSLWRALCAVLIVVAFVPFAKTPVAVAFGLGALCLAMGWWDRIAAFVLAGMWIACGAVWPERGPMGAAVAGALLLHGVTPPRPFGSLAALGRSDPSGSWIRPAWTHAVAWVLLAAVDTYAIVSLTAIAAWPELAWMWALLLVFVLLPISPSPSVLRFAWLASIGLHVFVAWTTAVGYDAYAIASITLIRALAFDPGWIAPKAPEVTELVFYDGDCGLCHRIVRFLLAEDRRARAFEFAPLQGPTFREKIPPDVRATLPDSLIVPTADGRVLSRSRAVLHAMKRLGGLWRAGATLASAVPPPILDRAYDGIARARHRLFSRPESACPILPPHLMRRFQT